MIGSQENLPFDIDNSLILDGKPSNFARRMTQKMSASVPTDNRSKWRNPCQSIRCFSRDSLRESNAATGLQILYWTRGPMTRGYLLVTRSLRGHSAVQVTSPDLSQRQRSGRNGIAARDGSGALPDIDRHLPEAYISSRTTPATTVDEG